MKKSKRTSSEDEVVAALEAGRLPTHRGDPFDRMLIAQTLAEGMVLLTRNRIFEKYDVEQIFCSK
jgi:PIN domain nuclease of toxin-antitoxin system